MLTIALFLVVGLGTTMAVSCVAEMQGMNYEGYLADVLCATRVALDGADMMRHPEKHSVACLKENSALPLGTVF